MGHHDVSFGNTQQGSEGDPLDFATQIFPVVMGKGTGFMHFLLPSDVYRVGRSECSEPFLADKFALLGV
jgi:hypothetical protein